MKLTVHLNSAGLVLHASVPRILATVPDRTVLRIDSDNFRIYDREGRRVERLADAQVMVLGPPDLVINDVGKLTEIVLRGMLVN